MVLRTQPLIQAFILYGLLPVRMPVQQDGSPAVRESGSLSISKAEKEAVTQAQEDDQSMRREVRRAVSYSSMTRSGAVESIISPCQDT